MSALKKIVMQRSECYASQYETVDPDLMILKRTEKYMNPNVVPGTVRFELDDRSEPYDPTTYYDVCMKWQEWETDEEFEKRKSEHEAQKHRELEGEDTHR